VAAHPAKGHKNSDRTPAVGPPISRRANSRGPLAVDPWRALAYRSRSCEFYPHRFPATKPDFRRVGTEHRARVYEFKAQRIAGLQARVLRAPCSGVGADPPRHVDLDRARALVVDGGASSTRRRRHRRLRYRCAFSSGYATKEQITGHGLHQVPNPLSGDGRDRVKTRSPCGRPQGFPTARRS